MGLDAAIDIENAKADKLPLYTSKYHTFKYKDVAQD